MLNHVINKPHVLLSLSIILGSFIFGSFFLYNENQKRISEEKQASIKMEIEEKKILAEKEKQDMDRQIAEQQAQKESKIRSLCAEYLDRKGNYLVSNETLQTNYNACIHQLGL